MSTTTTNLGLIKPEKTDAADITATNPNWDKIDDELTKKLPTTGGELSDELIVNENFQVRKTLDGVPYRSYVKPITYSISGDGNYSTALIHYNNGQNDSQLFFNKDGVVLRDNVNGKAYHVYGAYNADLIKKICLPISGGTIDGSVMFDRSDGTQGYGQVYKNNSATVDYGFSLRDFRTDGNSVSIDLSAKNNKVSFKDINGAINELHGGHNKPSGQYVGDGTSTQRTIKIGGTGIGVLITGNGYMSLVTGYGAITKKNTETTVQGLTSSQVLLDSSGGLRITTDNAALNKLAAVYEYQVL